MEELKFPVCSTFVERGRLFSFCNHFSVSVWWQEVFTLLFLRLVSPGLIGRK